MRTASITIGELVKRLQSKYPDLSISKVRYLEEEGLLSPARTASGYRSYSEKDVARLERILYLQKNYFYPLAVIKEELDKKGTAQPQVNSYQDGKTPLPQGSEDKKHALDTLPALLGVDMQFIRQLADFGLITFTVSPKGRTLVDGKELKLILAAADLKRYGVEARHLKTYLNAVHRESVIFEQVLSGIVGKQKSEISEQDKTLFHSTLAQMEALTNDIRSALLHKEIGQTFTGLDL